MKYRRDDFSRGPSEKMIVPTFSGQTSSSGDDLGMSARSYLRQISAWRRMTRMSEDQQGLTLYQHLTDRAWIDAERLDMDRLASRQGVDYFVEWIKDRYLDVQVTQIGRSLSGFFRGLRRRSDQSVRDYMAEFDRAYSRLTEVGCHLPDVAAAWVFVDRMGLEEQAELNLLASVGNQYSLKALQQAAIVHDRGLRKPWENQSRPPRKDWSSRKPYTTHLTGIEEYEAYETAEPYDTANQEEDEYDCVNEEVAQELFQAFMTHETAKQRYRENAKLRGSDPETLKQLASDRLKAAKAKSFCAGCKRRGHWHKDAVCPLNRGNSEGPGVGTAGTKSAPTPVSGAKADAKTMFPCHVVHVTWEIDGYSNNDLLAITDTACSKSVAGSSWIDSYLMEARRLGCDPQFTSCREAFKFGASKVFMASYRVVLCFELGGYKVSLRVAVVNGDVPLLVSRGALGALGMVLDVAENKACFKKLDVKDMALKVTETGHPAFQIVPSVLPKSFAQDSKTESSEIRIFPRGEQYTAGGDVRGPGDDSDGVMNASASSGSMTCSTCWMVSTCDGAEDDRGDGARLCIETRREAPTFKLLFSPKKIGLATRNFLLDARFSPATFATWWSSTNVSNDFWVENEEYLVRVHVIPRRTFFNPQHWKTSNSVHKEELLQSLGVVRSVNAISCKSHKEFPAVHGFWDSQQDESTFPVLWIGRTVFRRRFPMPTSAPSCPLLADGSEVRPFDGADGMQAQDFVGVQQGRALGGGPCEEFVDKRQMVDCGAPVSHPGGQEEPVCKSSREHHEGHAQHDVGGAEDPSDGVGIPCASPRDPGNPDEDPTRPRGDGTGVSAGIWPLPRQSLQRDACGVSHLGLTGSASQRQPIRGSRDVRELVAGRAPQMEWCAEGEQDERSLRCGGERHHTVCGGGEFDSLFVGHATEGGHRTCDSSQGEECAPRLWNSDPKDTGEEKIGRWTGDAHHGSDGTRATTGCERGSPVPGGEIGTFEGPTWTPTQAMRVEDAANCVFKCEKDPFDGENHGLSGGDPTELDGYYDDFLDHLYEEGTEEIYVTNHDKAEPDVNEEFHETPKPDKEKCEKLARDRLAAKDFNFDTLLRIARLLPLRKLRKGKALRRGGGASFEYFLGGIYSYGNMVGVSNQSSQMPWTVKYVNSFMKSLGVTQWSSFVLFKNSATQVHADVHNMPNTDIKTVSFGPFLGGELWMHDEERAHDDPGTMWRKDEQGKDLPGFNVDTKESVHSFSGKIKHATQPWSGERWALSCFTSRGYNQTSVAQRDQLRELRFGLRGLPLRVGTGENEKAIDSGGRPIKSIRKALWRKAGRLAALTTWCVAASATWTAQSFPVARGQDAVSLFEIGDYTKTLEVTALDYLAAEPFDYAADDHDILDPKIVQHTIQEFTPAVIWLHGSKSVSYLEDIIDYLFEHIDRGRQLALAAQPEDPCWNNTTVQKMLDRYDGMWTRRDGECDVLRVNDPRSGLQSGPIDHEDIPQFDAYMIDNKPEVQDEEENPKFGAEAISFSGGRGLASEVKSSLRRLHQNLGHPSNTDLARHLRLAGADPVVVDACKRLQCQVCQRNKRGASAKPASLPNLLSFNQVVAVDASYVYDTDGEKVELMMAVDVGTGFVLAGELQGHSTKTMEASFCTIWSNIFGAPGTLVVDLESGLQAGLARFSEWHGTYIRPIAGQAHWQNGTVERAIRTWKEVWGRIIDERSATAEEANMVITAVNNAMNTLRRDSGFSPSQAVWGRDPKLPEEIHGSYQDDHVEHIMSHDRQRAREHTIRIAAKEAYFRCQNDARLRKGLLQRSRVGGPELHVGAHVFFYRKPKNNKNWVWHGPGVVIGEEGPNFWISFSGRCHLVAPEHLRLASSEELGAAFALRSTQADLEKLLEQDFGDEEIYEDLNEPDVEMEEDPTLPQGDPDDLPDQEVRGEGQRRRSEEAPAAPIPKRYRRKGPEAHEASQPNVAYMLKMPKTPRGREKALEKEIPWAMVPADMQESFKQAEQKQWLEHRDHQALEPLSVEASREILQDRPHRVLNSRFAYRDKNWSRRREDEAVGWKPKARLVIAGHRDPDLLSGLPTHAPTISRQGIHLLLQILASNLSRGWKGYAGDVTAAFLCGEDLERELYLRQPKSGLGDLHPEQLLRIRKPIFGLVDSPSAWWQKFHKTLKKLRVKRGSEEWMVVQSTLDHCIFMVQKINGYDSTNEPLLGTPEAYLGVHVDDVLLVGQETLCDLLKHSLSAEFPIQDWEGEKFEYVGSFIEILEDRVKVTQASYANTRLFQVETRREVPDHHEANEIEKHDNQSLIGALSWMASQTRPDLQVGVSMCQQCQKSPTVGDIKFTNQLARRAMEHKEEGLTFYPVNLQEAVLLCYHDAGWANVPQCEEDPFYKLTDEENQAGKLRDGPLARREAKMKKTNSTIASQLGGLYIFVDKAVLSGAECRGSILDWRSGACERVCRSTFAAETMGCGTAIETGDFITKFLETLLTGKLARTTTRFELRFLSDCRSLYDHLTRDGVPRVPTCKRLAIDLAGIRQDLKAFGRIVWVPTGAQLADILTKPLRPEAWWNTIREPLKLTFREGEGSFVQKLHLEPV